MGQPNRYTVIVRQSNLRICDFINQLFSVGCCLHWANFPSLSCAGLQEGWGGTWNYSPSVLGCRYGWSTIRYVILIYALLNLLVLFGDFSFCSLFIFLWSSRKVERFVWQNRYWCEDEFCLLHWWKGYSYSFEQNQKSTVIVLVVFGG